MTQDNATKQRVKSFVERIERLEAEKLELSEDIKELYSEAKGTGFDVKALKRIVKLRASDKNKLQEEAAILQLYAEAIDMPLFGLLV